MTTAMHCEPETVFLALKALARHTVDAYNRQLSGEHFRFEDIDGISFRVSRPGIDTTRGVSIVLSGTDLSAIRVVSNKFAARRPVKYTVLIDESGACRLKREGDDQLLDLGQVLTAALESLGMS